MRAKSLIDYIKEYDKPDELMSDCIRYWFDYVVDIGDEFILDDEIEVGFSGVDTDGLIEFIWFDSCKYRKYEPLDLLGRLSKNGEQYL